LLVYPFNLLYVVPPKIREAFGLPSFGTEVSDDSGIDHLPVVFSRKN
jgi:hypothetical protein